MTPKITHIHTLPYRLPLHEPLAWGKASVLNDAHHVLLRVTLSDGAQGWAEAPPRPTIYGETVESICRIVAQELAPRLLGEGLDEATLPKLTARMAQIANNQTARGSLDIALHDALAMSRGVSLAEHLGAVQEKLRVSYILGIGAEEAVLEEAARVVGQGVRVLKVKVGREWEADVARILRLSELLGPDVDLYADANECFTAENGQRRLAALAEMGLLYCEEPLPVELVRERSALAAANALPVIADDSTFSLRDLRRELALDSFHILNIKTARTGYTESAAMLAAALAAGKGVMIGSQASTGLGTVRAALFAAQAGIEHPSELSFFLKLQSDLLDRPLLLHDGYLHLSEIADARIDPDKLKDASV
ncbi:MAG: enolase [Caldilineaceae bacterium]|nr:enolase [Caldilineaceae bacterium]